MQPKHAEEAADWERHGYAKMKPRGDLALRMIAAWNNTTVDAMPQYPTFRTFPNSSAEAGWERVARAAMAYLQEFGMPTNTGAKHGEADEETPAGNGKN
jgi:hypothetical protein